MSVAWHPYRRGAALVGGLLAAGAVAAALLHGGESHAAAPRVPVDDGLVLERLTGGAGDPVSRELAALRARLDEDPTDRARATEYAKKNIEASRRASDPRFLGHAQAALAPWWSQAVPPDDVLLLRATIRQSLHEFDLALADLTVLVAHTPDDPQVWLTRAVVLAVGGRYAEARQSCMPLGRLASGWATATCFASVDSQSGKAKEAYRKLAATLGREPPTDAAGKAWALSSLGEVAMRAGDDAAAESEFRSALEADPSDVYARAALADLLLDRGRAAEVIPLLAGKESDDGLLLRLALAETKVGAAAAKDHVATLRARHQASRDRGDVVHRREQARFELAFGKPQDALALARANWDVQKEPWDARVLLEAALAAGQPVAARVVTAFLGENHTEEPRLVALAARVAGAS
jgi:tetratricopeptide (TPR) repeat protein